MENETKLYMEEGFLHYVNHPADNNCVVCTATMISVRRQIVDLVCVQDYFIHHVSSFCFQFDCCRRLDYVYNSLENNESNAMIHCPQCSLRRFNKCNVRACKKRRYGEKCKGPK